MNSGRRVSSRSLAQRLNNVNNLNDSIAQQDLLQNYLADTTSQNYLQTQLNAPNTAPTQPISTPTNEEEEEETKKKIEGTFFEQVGATVADIGYNLAYGDVKSMEGVLDFFMSFNPNWKNIVSSNLTEELFGDKYLGWAEEYEKNKDKSWIEWLDQNYTKGIVRATTQAVGEQLPRVALAIATGGGSEGASAAVTTATKVGSTAMFVTSAYGSGVEQALNDGATLAQAHAYGTLSAGVEMLTEQISNIGGVKERIAFKGALDGTLKKLSSNVAVRTLMNMGGEFIEEAISEAAEPLLKYVAYEKTQGKEIQFATAQEIFEAGLIGALSSGVLESGNIAVARKRLGSYTVAMNESDAKQTISELDKLWQEEKRTLDRQNGYLTQKQIDDFAKRRNILKGNLQAQLEAIVKRMNKMSTEKAENVKSKFEKAYADNNIIMDNYNVENGEFEDTFKADLHLSDDSKIIGKDGKVQYSDKGYKLVVDADAKITNKIKKNAVLAARAFRLLNQDKDARLVITDQLGKDESGKYENNTLYVNANNDDILTTVLGHEYTHYLEKYKEYDTFKKFVLEQLKQDNKLLGEYKKELASRKEAYEKKLGKELTSDYIDDEILADFVGKYLVNDKSFIESLSKEKPSLFKRLKSLFDKFNKNTKGLSTEEKAFLKEAQEKFREVLNSEKNKFTVLNDNKKMYDYDTLVSKNDLTIMNPKNIADISKNITDNELMDIVKRNAIKYADGKTTEKGFTVTNNDLGIDIIIGKRGINHGLESRKSNYDALLAASFNIGELVKDAVAINELPARNENQNGSIVFANIMKYDNSIYGVRIIINENKSFDSFDIFNLSAINTKKEVRNGNITSALQADNTSSTISVAQFLEYCKNIPMISSNLSKTVKQKLGINYESDLNVKYSLSRDQNDLIAQSYEIQYSKTKDGDINLYMTDKNGDIVYTHPMITELSLKNRLGSDLSKFIIENATNEVQYLRRNDIEKYIKELDNTDLHKKAQKMYKHTNNTRIAAYLDLDGFMYDLDNGDSDGYYRGTDHRDIQSVTEGLTGSQAMEEFIYQGNIRLKPESNGFELAKLPTDKQFSKLEYWINQRNDDDIFIDMWKPSDSANVFNNSDNLIDLVYPAYTSAYRIIRDIKNYYENGTIPNQRERGIRYSLSKDKKLVAIHNLSENKLLNALELGGFPMPSIAVLPYDRSHVSYGDISIIFKESTVDPKKSTRNKIYSGDAWTVTFPTIKFAVDEKSFNEFIKKTNKYYQLLDKYTDYTSLFRGSSTQDILDSLKYDSIMKAWFLEEKGEALPLTYTNKVPKLYPFNEKSTQEEINLYREQLRAYDKDFRERYPKLEYYANHYNQLDTEIVLKERKRISDFVFKYTKEWFKTKTGYTEKWDNLLYHELDLSQALAFLNDLQSELDGTLNEKRPDRFALDEYVSKTVDKNDKDFQEWLLNKITEIGRKPYMRNNNDYYDAKGYPRSFSQLYSPYTLENAVKIMANQLQQKGTNSWFGAGTGTINAANIKEYKSINEVKEDLGKVAYTQEEYEKDYKKYDAKTNKLVDEIGKYKYIVKPTNNLDYLGLDSTMRDFLQEVAATDKSESSIRRLAKEWYFQKELPNSLITKIQNYFGELNNKMVKYFEAKPARPITFDEIQKIIIPDTTSDYIKNELKKKGVEVIEYTNENPREQIIKNDESIRFSLNFSEENAEKKVYEISGYNDSTIVNNSNMYDLDNILGLHYYNSQKMKGNYKIIADDEESGIKTKKAKKLPSPDKFIATIKKTGELVETRIVDLGKIRDGFDAKLDELWKNGVKSGIKYVKVKMADYNKKIPTASFFSSNSTITNNGRIRMELYKYTTADGSPKSTIIFTGNRGESFTYAPYRPNPEDNFYEVTFEDTAPIINEPKPEVVEKPKVEEVKETPKVEETPLENPLVKSQVGRAEQVDTSTKETGIVKYESGRKKNVSKWFETARESEEFKKNFTEEMVEVLEKEDELTYEVIGNNETIATAKEYVDKTPLTKAYNEISAKFESGQAITANDVAIGTLIAEKLARQNRYGESVDLIATMSPRLTDLGRAIQAASIIQRLTPEGKLKAFYKKKVKIDEKNAKVKGTKKANDRILKNMREKYLPMDIRQAQEESLATLEDTLRSDKTYTEDDIQRILNEVKGIIYQRQQMTEYNLLNIFLKMGANRRTAKKMASDFTYKYNEDIINVEKMYDRYDSVIIPRSLAAEFIKAKNEKERAKASKKLQIAMNEQAKVSFYEKVQQWRYLSMLANPKTHIRNIVSNFVMHQVSKVKDGVATIVESTIAKPLLKGERANTFKKVSKELNAYGMEVAEKQHTIFAESISKYNAVNEGTTVFENRFLEKLRLFNNRLLENVEDKRAFKRAFAYKFGKWATANGYSIEFLKDPKNAAILEKGTQLALQEGLEQTYKDYSTLVATINQMKTKSKVADLLISTVMPFTKTPINIARRGIEYSPLGLAKRIAEIRKVRNGQMSATAWVNKLSKNLTGTMITMLGVALAKMHLVSGASDDDKEGKYAQELGKKPFSIKIGDKYFTLDWLAPASIPFFTGVAIYDTINQEYDAQSVELSDYFDIISSTLDPLTEMTFLKSLNDAISSYSGNKLVGVGQNMAKSYATSFIPTILSQGAKVFNLTDGKLWTTTTRRTTAKTGDSSYFINTLKSKIPFLYDTLEPYIDVWGREDDKENFVNKFMTNMVYPFWMYNNEETPVDTEILDLYKKYGNTDILPKTPKYYYTKNGEKVEMTSKEYTQFKKDYGTFSYNSLEALFKTDYYKNLTDEDKEKAIAKVYTYALSYAKHDTVYTQAKVLKMDSSIATHLVYLNNLTSDVDSKTGKTIQNSKRDKAFKYINSIKSLNKQQKYLLMVMSGYKVKDSVRVSLAKYLRTLVRTNTISKEEYEYLLEKYFS